MDGSRMDDQTTRTLDLPDHEVADSSAPGDGAFTSQHELLRFDRLLAGLVVGLTILSFATLLPGQPFAIQNGNLDLVLSTLTALAAAGAAALAWVRFRIERELSALYECSAFLVLFATRALLIGIAVVGHPERVG